MNKTKKILLLIIAALPLISGSCDTLVYSPSLGLSDTRLKQNQIDFSLGFCGLPTTRPSESEDMHFGVVFNLGYGFLDNFNLNVSGWQDIADFNSRCGYSIQSRFILNEDANSCLELIPRAAILYFEDTLSGKGIEIACVEIYKFNKALYCYYGIGLAAGTNKYKLDRDKNYNLSYPSGYGVFGHFALGWKMSTHFRAVFEFNPIYQVNQIENREDFIFAPSLTFGYIF